MSKQVSMIDTFHAHQFYACKHLSGHTYICSMCTRHDADTLWEDELSLRAGGPRTMCPPGHIFLGPDVPHHDRMSPRPI